MAGGSKKPKKPQKRLRLRVIPEPEPDTRTVLIYTGKGNVVMKGPGNAEFSCGACERPLVTGVNEGQISNIVFRCKACGAYNEFPA